MRSQQEIWRKEHEKTQTLPAMADKKPASSVVEFWEAIQERLPESGIKAIDIGCGKGRNTVYLAQQGVEVYAMDYIELAIEFTRQRAQRDNLADRVHAFVSPIDETWNFQDHYFDLAIDCFSSIDIETREGREIYREEMFRTLKPGGLAFVSVVSAGDEVEARIAKTTPGTEPNSTIWPSTHKFQKNYSESELLDFYSNFEVIRFELVRTAATKLGLSYTASDYILWLKRP